MHSSCFHGYTDKIKHLCKGFEKVFVRNGTRDLGLQTKVSYDVLKDNVDLISMFLRLFWNKIDF